MTDASHIFQLKPKRITENIQQHNDKNKFQQVSIRNHQPPPKIKSTTNGERIEIPYDVNEEIKEDNVLLQIKPTRAFSKTTFEDMFFIPEPIVQDVPKPQLYSNNQITFSKDEIDKMIESEENYEEIETDIDRYEKQHFLFIYEPFLVNEIYENLRQKEKEFVVSSIFLSKHIHLTERHREKLVDWLFDISFKMFHFKIETFLLCIRILDDYLDKSNNVLLKQFQLIGVVCLFLSSKYEEVRIPHAEMFVYLCGDKYSIETLLEMERIILNTISYRLTRPHSIDFLRRFNRVWLASTEHHIMGKYCIQIATLQSKFSLILPSKLAAACVYLERMIYQEYPIWNKSLSYWTEYEEVDIIQVARDLRETFEMMKTPLYNFKKMYHVYAENQNKGVSMKYCKAF